MCKVIVFAGTTEGYGLCRFLESHGVSVCACTATDYGARALEEGTYLSVRAGRLKAEEMKAFFETKGPSLILDATHPYAVEATKNIQTAAREAGISYVRVLRGESAQEKRAVYVHTVEEAADYLKSTTGNVLVTTGSKELSAFTEVPDYENRIFARVLSLASVAEASAALGFEGKNLICMQGPFSRELNAAMLRQYDCRYLVTKDSGSAGGFPEKLLACEECGVVPVIVGRPCKEEGLSPEACRRYLSQVFGFSLKARVSLVGIGMGTQKTLTYEAREVLEQADLIIGARRMTEAAARPGQAVLVEYQPEKIAAFIQEHPEYEQVAVALSGDVGFYSGAKKLLKLLGAETRLVCGISSAAYFMGKIGLSWEDALLVSAHGRDCNLVGAIREHKKVFGILGTRDGIRTLADKLTAYGLGEVLLYVGEQLSYPEERIFAKPARELTAYEGDALCVFCACNPEAIPLKATHGIRDEAFLRGNAPMTKEEVRCVSLGKLGLLPDSVCYDVGAGTGSVAIEMALRANRGQVYAIEKKEEALALLLENKKKFCADNLMIVPGTAPEILKDLPAPTHAFIGGSSGSLREIVEALLSKNPQVILVINCITLETLSEALAVIKEHEALASEVVQIAAARSKEVGRYHMMMGENPIYILTIGPKERRM